MNIKDKIKNELAKRLWQEADDGFIEIRMKKSNDVVIITPDGPEDDPETVYELKGYKLQKIYAVGLDELAQEIMNYDRTVEKQQKLILDIYAFEREKLETGTASESEIEWYIDVYEGLFGYKPPIAA